MTKKNTSTIKEFVENTVSEVLQESSLSRLWQHMQEHDCAIISAMRDDPNDLSLCANPQDTKHEDDHLKLNNIEKSSTSLNKLRTKNLRASLLYFGFGVTPVDGSFVENFKTDKAKEVKENSFFVVNVKDDPEFISKIELLGQKFCQDSVLIVPKGGNTAFVIGTNNNNSPGLGNREDLGAAKFGKEDMFMTKIRNRPLTFAEGLEHFNQSGWGGKLTIHTIAHRVLGIKK